MNQKLIDFYSGEGTDSQERDIYDLLTLSHQDLEGCHDYIQWLFPLKEPSLFNPDAPLLDEETIDAFTNNVSCMEHLAEAADMMLGFYFPWRDKNGNCFAAVKPEWLTKGNHNYLRLTRIITSLKLLNLDEIAYKFFNILMVLWISYPDEIGTETFEYWRNAALPC